MAYVGIDLGTTYSCVAVIENGRPFVIFGVDGRNTIPSVVAYSDKEILVGNTALTEIGNIDLTNILYDSKRLIGWKFINNMPSPENRHLWTFNAVTINEHAGYILNKGKVGKERFILPEEVSGEILKHLKFLAETYLSRHVMGAVITIPVLFNQNQIAATKRAMELAGLETKELLYEPQAVAIAYSARMDLINCKMLIIDLGGGTTDVTIFEVKDGNLTIIARSGDEHLGGNDFDGRIIKHVINELQLESLGAFTKRELFLKKLREKCRSCKESLSSNIESYNINLGIRGDIELNIKLTKEKLNELCDDLFQRIIIIIEEVMKSVQLSVNEIDHVILAGGSSRIPKIKGLIENIFGVEKMRYDINTKEAVAYGAAILAKSLELGEKLHILENISINDVLAKEIMINEFEVNHLPTNFVMPLLKVVQTLRENKLKSELYNDSRKILQIFAKRCEAFRRKSGMISRRHTIKKLNALAELIEKDLSALKLIDQSEIFEEEIEILRHLIESLGRLHRDLKKKVDEKIIERNDEQEALKVLIQLRNEIKEANIKLRNITYSTIDLENFKESSLRTLTKLPTNIPVSYIEWADILEEKRNRIFATVEEVMVKTVIAEAMTSETWQLLKNIRTKYSQGPQDYENVTEDASILKSLIDNIQNIDPIVLERNHHLNQEQLDIIQMADDHQSLLNKKIKLFKKLTDMQERVSSEIEQLFTEIKNLPKIGTEDVLKFIDSDDMNHKIQQLKAKINDIEIQMCEVNDTISETDLNKKYSQLVSEIEKSVKNIKQVLADKLQCEKLDTIIENLIQDVRRVYHDQVDDLIKSENQHAKILEKKNNLDKYFQQIPKGHVGNELRRKCVRYTHEINNMIILKLVADIRDITLLGRKKIVDKEIIGISAKLDDIIDKSKSLPHRTIQFNSFLRSFIKLQEKHDEEFKNSGLTSTNERNDEAFGSFLSFFITNTAKTITINYNDDEKLDDERRIFTKTVVSFQMDLSQIIKEAYEISIDPDANPIQYGPIIYQLKYFIDQAKQHIQSNAQYIDPFINALKAIIISAENQISIMENRIRIWKNFIEMIKHVIGPLKNYCLTIEKLAIKSKMSLEDTEKAIEDIKDLRSNELNEDKISQLLELSGQLLPHKVPSIFVHFINIGINNNESIFNEISVKINREILKGHTLSELFNAILEEIDQLEFDEESNSATLEYQISHGEQKIIEIENKFKSFEERSDEAKRQSEYIPLDSNQLEKLRSKIDHLNEKIRNAKLIVEMNETVELFTKLRQIIQELYHQYDNELMPDDWNIIKKCCNKLSEEKEDEFINKIRDLLDLKKDYDIKSVDGKNTVNNINNYVTELERQAKKRRSELIFKNGLIEFLTIRRLRALVNSIKDDDLSCPNTLKRNNRLIDRLNRLAENNARELDTMLNSKGAILKSTSKIHPPQWEKCVIT